MLDINRIRQNPAEVAAALLEVETLDGEQFEALYTGEITAAELAKVAEYTEAVKPYRPVFLGVSLKPQGAQTQAMKIGWTLNDAYIEGAGYTVVGGGAVVLAEGDYDGKSVINEDTAGVKTAAARKTAEGYCGTTIE